MMSFATLENSFVFEASVDHGAMFLQALKNVMECKIREHDTIQYIKRYDILNEIHYIMIKHNII